MGQCVSIPRREYSFCDLTSLSAIMKLALVFLFGLVAMTFAFGELDMGRGIEEDEYEDEMEFDDGSGGPTKPPRKQCRKEASGIKEHIRCMRRFAKCFGSVCLKPCKKAYGRCHKKDPKSRACRRNFVKCIRKKECRS